MGHSADATNRLKSNKALRTKVNSYDNFKLYSKLPPSNKRYNFKKLTLGELKKLEESNRLFLERRKNRNRVILIFAFAVGITVLYWFSQTELWAGYIEGFGKYVR